MNKIFLYYLLIIFALCGGCATKVKSEIEAKTKIMWFDAKANFERFSYPDSIDFYLEKIKRIGFTDAVVDVRPTSGKVLFESRFAPIMREQRGFVRPDFDYLDHFIRKAHALGLKVHASVNVFVPFKYCSEDSIEKSSIVYTPQREMIAAEKSQYSATVNPVDIEFQEHVFKLLKELVVKYPDLDGVILDRVRYGGIMADFSEMSKAQFEKYIGVDVSSFPSDIYEWKIDENGKYTYTKGRLFNKWLEWRAKNIYDFMDQAQQVVKNSNPDISFGTYTGAWYPSYFEVGANWASNRYDASLDFDWATANYKNFGYAEVLDLFMVGNYYKNVTKEEHIKTNQLVQNETDNKAYRGLWYCVEGSCENVREIMKGNPFLGGVLVDKYYDNPRQLKKAIAMNLQVADGLMVFDISHVIEKNLWNEVIQGFIIAEN